MAFIVQQFANDNGVQLAQEDLVRSTPWGSNWQKMRVGCRLAMNAYSTINYGVFGATNPRFGVCTGPEASNSYVTTDCLAWMCINSGRHFVLGGSAPYKWLSINGGSDNMSCYQKTNNTWNYGGAYTGGQITCSANPEGWHSAWFVDFTKISASVMSTQFYCPAVAGPVEWTRSNFLAVMENENGPINSVGLGTSITLTRQVGDWDSVYIGGIRNLPTLVVYDLTTVRFY